MAIQIIAICLIATSLLLAGLAIKSLIKKNWFFQWLRGTSGFSILFITLLISLFALDLFGYSSTDEGKVIATLRFNAVEHQIFDVELADEKGVRTTYKLYGDQWQLDARLISIALLLKGSLPSYKLDRLSGRYLSLEQERNEIRGVHSLAKEGFVDTWPWLVEKQWLPFIDAKYGSATFMPMAQGAIYQVKLNESGLQAEPVNEQARAAVEAW